MPSGKGTYGNKRGRPRKKSVGMGITTRTIGKRSAMGRLAGSKMGGKKRTSAQMAALRKAQKASAMRRKK